MCRHHTPPSHLKVVLGDFDRTVFEDYAQMTAGVEEVIEYVISRYATPKQVVEVT